jgi:hypothetical protein
MARGSLFPFVCALPIRQKMNAPSIKVAFFTIIDLLWKLQYND